MRRCRHTTEMPVNFVFFVPQAMMKGLMKLGRWVSSRTGDLYESGSVYETRKRG